MSKMRFFALQELANRRPLPVDYPSEKLSEYYGAHVFDRKKMQEFLPQEAYKAVINANISKEMSDFAQGEIDKLDAKNEKRKNTQTKAQKENEGIKSQIVECLKENGALVASVMVALRRFLFLLVDFLVRI